MKTAAASPSRKGKQLQKRHAELVEQSFAHLCAIGGARRTWIRGLVEVGKRHLVGVMAHNLGVIMSKVFGVEKPKEWAGLCPSFAALERLFGRDPRSRHRVEPQKP